MNDNQWMPWIKLLKDYDADMSTLPVVHIEYIGLLEGVKEKDKLLVALAFAVANWHPDVSVNRGGGPCALCMLYKGACSKCVLFKKTGLTCHEEDSLFIQFVDSWPEDSDKAANKMYETLLELYKEEYRKRNIKGVGQ